MTVRPVMTVLRVVISDLIVRLVHSTAILVRHVVTLVQTARLVHSVPTAMVVAQTA
jgi:NAD(P)H-dependent flavin oxidoreductase YrpB (nitropropane dioxygenase family)